VRARALVIALSFSITSCNSIGGQGLNVLSVAGSDQLAAINSKSGMTRIMSRRPSSDILVELSSDDSWKEYGTSIILKIRNRGKSSILFSGSNISILQESSAGKVLDYDGMRALLEEQRQAKETLATIGMIAGAVVTGLAGSGRFNSQTSVALAAGGMTTFQLAAAGLVQARVDAITENDETPGTFISTTILGPNKQLGGRIIVKDVDVSRAVVVNINVGSDVHPIRLQSRGD
jgi:predicted small secreted protein